MLPSTVKPPKGMDTPEEMRMDIRSKIWQGNFSINGKLFHLGYKTKGSPLPTIRMHIRSKQGPANDSSLGWGLL